MREQLTPGVEKLSQSECLALLGEHRLGRLAFTDRALPTIRPLSYSLLGSEVLLRVPPERLRSQLDGQVVAFAVDELDEETGVGWSVVLTGPVRMVERPGELLRLGPQAPVALPATRVCLLTGQIEGWRYGAVA
jgi:nitroimidazol reductase NimA-like FMN-containing flavoprotein (pyridoxamine 5'-phosphate oxidase superfamily)